MKILADTKRMFTLLAAVFFLSSCAEDSFSDGTGGGTSNRQDAEVSIVVKVPGSSSPATRALREEVHDAEVNEIVVLQFTEGQTDPGQNLLKFVSKSEGEPVINNGTLTFNVKLLTGGYNIVVLANSVSIYDKVRDTNGGDLRGKKYDDLQKLFIKAVEGSDGESDKWNADSTDTQKGYLIPMWGLKSNVTITDQESNQIIQTVHLYRMLAKIDVSVQRTAENGYDGVPLSDFRLQHVSFHNYNRTGLVMPGLTSGNWEAENGANRKAYIPSLLSAEDKVSGETRYQKWTTMTEENDALKGEIFTFEASAGTNYTDRPCIIIGGYYNWDGIGDAPNLCYYRIDMVGTSGGVNSHFNLLRNHKYNVVIRKVKGAGYPSVEEAYRSKPTNITADVIPWNDGEYTEGVWEGMNEISFTSRTAYFTQFGTPSDQIFKVRTTADNLKFGSFRSLSVPIDKDIERIWGESSTVPNEWSNGHFTIEISDKVTTPDGYTEYQLKISADPAVENDGERKASFKVAAFNLEATFTITQDKHVTYNLVTNPASNHVFIFDGAARDFMVDVISTHSYVVDWDTSNGLIEGIYVNDAPIDPNTIIDTNTKSIKLVLSPLTDSGVRAAEFRIKHSDVNSNASPADFTVIQKRPIISASLVAGELSELTREGGSVKINVVSNVHKWNPILKDNKGDLISADYFDISEGSGNAIVTFKVPAMGTDDNEDRTFTITFKDANGDTKSTPEIIITQIAKLPGSGSGGKDGGTGINAIPGILAVNSKGQLNLDGEGYLVYFKYGSLIATWSRDNGDDFDVMDVAWTPDGYDYETLIANIDKKIKADAWAYIPYASNMSTYPGGGAVIDYEGFPDYPDDLPQNIYKGLGDPCKYAYASSGKKYRTPKGGNHGTGPVEYDEPPSGDMTPDDNAYGIIGRWYNKGLPGAQFYPAGGVRVSDTGKTDRPELKYSYYSYFGGYFWCSKTETAGAEKGSNRGSAMRFKYSTVDVTPMHHRSFGFLVRCMEDK